MRVNIKRKKKMETAIELVKRMRKEQEEIGVVLKRAQEKIKQQANKR